MARVLLLTHIYPPAIDGGSRVIAKIGDYLKKHNHQILVLTSNCTSTDDFVSTRHRRLKIDDGQHIIRLPIFTIFHRPLKFLARIFPNFKTISKGPIFTHLPLHKIIAFKPDFIIAGPLPTTIIIYAHLIRFFTKSKILFNPCFHPNDPDFQTPLLLSLLSKSDYLWCLTNYEQKYFHDKLNITRPVYFIHGLGVDTDFIIDKKLIKTPKIPNLLFIANFSAHKRCELLISAFEKVLKIYPSASLSLLGQKTLYFPVITKFLEGIDSNTKKHIYFVFNPNTTQIKNAIDQSTCLILPSIHESFGLVFVESLARGKVIIGADTPQGTQVINSLGGGLFFKTDNLDSLFEIIMKIIKNPSFSKKIAMTGYQNVKNTYTWDKIGKNLCKKLGI
jgi:glycosyltransferase involved in cell wall biosynthesis